MFCIDVSSAVPFEKSRFDGRDREATESPVKDYALAERSERQPRRQGHADHSRPADARRTDSDTSRDCFYTWMGDRWQSTPDKIKGHDFQYWGPLDFAPDGGILPLEPADDWKIEVR